MSLRKKVFTWLFETRYRIEHYDKEVYFPEYQENRFSVWKLFRYIDDNKPMPFYSEEAAWEFLETAAAKHILMSKPHVIRHLYKKASK